jgi:hypothetical protein
MYAYEYKFDKCKATGDNICRRQGQGIGRRMVDKYKEKQATPKN